MAKVMKMEYVENGSYGKMQNGVTVKVIQKSNSKFEVGASKGKNDGYTVDATYSEHSELNEAVESYKSILNLVKA